MYWRMFVWGCCVVCVGCGCGFVFHHVKYVWYYVLVWYDWRELELIGW